MIHSNDPRQNRLFDPFEGVIPPAGRKIIGNGWQGVFRHAILKIMPVDDLAQHFSETLGAPPKNSIPWPASSSSRTSSAGMLMTPSKPTSSDPMSNTP